MDMTYASLALMTIVNILTTKLPNLRPKTVYAVKTALVLGLTPMNIYFASKIPHTLRFALWGPQILIAFLNMYFY